MVMAVVCVKCDADVTEAIVKARVKTAFTCKCGSADFVEVPDPPKKSWELTQNDKRFLRSIRVGK